MEVVKKTIMLIFCVCNINSEARAVVLFLARTHDPKKAEEIWILSERANRDFLERRRNELKKKHAVKNDKLVAMSAEQVILSEESLKAKSLLSTSPASTEKNRPGHETKELETD